MDKKVTMSDVISHYNVIGLGIGVAIGMAGKDLAFSISDDVIIPLFGKLMGIKSVNGREFEPKKFGVALLTFLIVFFVIMFMLYIILKPMIREEILHSRNFTENIENNLSNIEKHQQNIDNNIKKISGTHQENIDDNIRKIANIYDNPVY